MKIVQRLPVRIELTDYDPDKLPLFVGLSVEPHVYYKQPPTGPNAGEFLQPNAPLPQEPTRTDAVPCRLPWPAATALPIPSRTHEQRGDPSCRDDSRRAINPWFIAIAVVVPTFMEVLDTTIANVALRYIAGGLSAAETDSEWVITSYLAANAMVLTISGWLSARLGRRNYFLLSIAVFTLASGLCGMATSLPQIILFRVIQGLAGGGLQPSSQAILIDSFPPEKQGTAMSMFGIAALIGPIVGPTLGGWLVVNYDWRWIFYINLPVGLIALAASYFLVQRSRVSATRSGPSSSSQPLNFDYIGLGLLALAISCWEILLSKGQEWDWFGDPFWRIQTLTVLFVVGLGMFIVRGLRSANPLLNLRVLGERNLAVSCIILFSAFSVLYAASIALPAMLQALFGYDAYHAGLVLSPGGISSISMLVIVSFLLGRGVDAR